MHVNIFQDRADEGKNAKTILLFARFHYDKDRAAFEAVLQAAFGDAIAIDRNYPERDIGVRIAIPDARGLRNTKGEPIVAAADKPAVVRKKVIAAIREVVNPPVVNVASLILKAIPTKAPKPAVAPKEYQITFKFRDLEKKTIQQVIAAIGANKFTKPENITGLNGDRKIFGEEGLGYYKFESELAEPIVSEQSKSEIIRGVRSQFNAALALARLQLKLNSNHDFFQVNEIQPPKVVPPVVQKSRKEKPPKPEPSPRVKPVGKLLHQPDPWRQSVAEAKTLAREMVPLFSHKLKPDDNIIRVDLQKADDGQFELILRGGNEKQHQAFRERIVNNFFGHENGKTHTVDAPAARAAVTHPPQRRGFAKKVTALAHPVPRPGSVAPDAALRPPLHPEMPQILESRFALGADFSNILLDYLKNHYHVRWQGSYSSGNSRFYVGGALTGKRKATIEFFNALGMSPNDITYGAKSAAINAKTLFAAIANLSPTDQELLLKVAALGEASVTKMRALRRGVEYPEYLRNPAIPRELFIEPFDEEFLEQAEVCLEKAPAGAPSIEVGGCEHHGKQAHEADAAVKNASKRPNQRF